MPFLKKLPLFICVDYLSNYMKTPKKIHLGEEPFILAQDLKGSDQHQLEPLLQGGGAEQDSKALWQTEVSHVLVEGSTENNRKGPRCILQRRDPTNPFLPTSPQPLTVLPPHNCPFKLLPTSRPNLWLDQGPQGLNSLRHLSPVEWTMKINHQHAQCAHWHTPVILVLGKLRLEDYEFEDSMGYILRPSKNTIT